MSGKASAVRKSSSGGGGSATGAEAPRRDRRAERRSATRDEILEAAWELSREQGLAVLSMRELGARVGMRAQSLYSYFPSKDAIYDAMFLAGNEELLRRMEQVAAGDVTPEERFRAGARAFLEFAVEDPTRSALLFLRLVPGFEPSEESYRLAVQVLDLARTRLADLGITDPGMLDLWTATLGGLINQQISNEPGGDRWVRLLDDVIDMYLSYAKRKELR